MDSEATDSKDAVRVNKFLATQLGISRRSADEAIEKGAVRVNGQPATLGARFDPERDELRYHDQLVTAKSELRYVLLNKPVGYVSSRRRQGDSPTIYELLPPSARTLKPVGRLDRDSSGLLLLTNDGDFAHQMTHPKFHKVKQYEVTLDTPLQPLHQQMINDIGVTLEDGVSRLTIEKLAPAPHERFARASGVGDEAPNSFRNKSGGQALPSYLITMHEGRNRQIRRTFAALGYTVTQLHRTVFGAYTLDGVATGKTKVTTKK